MSKLSFNANTKLLKLPELFVKQLIYVHVSNFIQKKLKLLILCNKIIKKPKETFLTKIINFKIILLQPKVAWYKFHLEKGESVQD